MIFEDDPLYTYVNAKKLRRGYTTGTCATAASKASALMLLNGEKLDKINLMTPKGIVLELTVEEIILNENSVSCAIRKDGGDDSDITHGTLIFSKVEKIPLGIEIDGGKGIGKVTRKGLDQPVGNVAINSVPRLMIKNILEEVCSTCSYAGGLKAIISVPEGEELAKKTFNSRLGITGGISIIGTSGIVEPMSESALIDTIKVEVRMNLENGNKFLLVVPGNYGEEFVKKNPEICSKEPIKCSNFVGEILDMAVQYGAEGLLLVGNLGKMVKIAGGVMNTHSKFADCRMEILASNSILAGADLEIAKRIMSCVSTDEALSILKEVNLIEKTMELIMEKIHFHLNYRTGGKILVGAVAYSTEYGLLGETQYVTKLIEKLKNQVMN